MSGSDWGGLVDAVRGRAADVAAPLAAAARRSTTVAQQRAILRLLGVDGLDAAGRPLAGAVLERYCGSDRRRLAGGVCLPFSVALLEYDLPPRELALEVAAGTIDLRLEAELLEREDRRTAAAALAERLASAAFARIEENRTASHDMRSVLGEPAEPWLGVRLRASEVDTAADEVGLLVSSGVDVVRVRIPASWELAEARGDEQSLSRAGGFDPPSSTAGDRGDASRVRHAATTSDPQRGGRMEGRANVAAAAVPAGSQRGLGVLRRAADVAAAERGAYARLMTVASAFAAPEQAVVAGFEQIDLVEADPLREIVDDSVDPERALADHAFANRLHVQAGCSVVTGAGPLALGADVARGVPPDAATRAGRGLALQALGVELALAGGLPPERVMLGAVPSWVGLDTDPREAVVQAWLRRALFPGHGLVLAQPSAAGRGGRGWPLALVAALGAARGGRGAALVLRDLRDHGRVHVAEAAEELRAAAASAAAYADSLGSGEPQDRAADLAVRALRTANDTLERLAGEGWGKLLGPVAEGDGARLGRSAVVERDAPLDPFGAALFGEERP